MFSVPSRAGKKNVRWYGFWKEQGPSYANFPSILESVSQDWPERQNNSLLHYLVTSPLLSVTFRGACLFCGELCYLLKDEQLSTALRTDGVWVWPDEIVHYIEHHGVMIPSDMFSHIKKKRYRIKSVDVEEIASDFPTLPLGMGQRNIRQLLDVECHLKLIDQARHEGCKAFIEGDYVTACSRLSFVREHLDDLEKQMLGVSMELVLGIPRSVQ